MPNVTIDRKTRSYNVVVKRTNISVTNPDVTYEIHSGGRRGLKGDTGENGRVYQVHAGDGIIVDNADPANPIIHASGGTGDKNYVQQFTMQSTLSITHGLQKYPSVSIINSAGDEVVGDVEYTGLNNLIVSFTAPFSGMITCN